MTNITQEFISMIKLPDESGKSLNFLIVMSASMHTPGVPYVLQSGLCYVSSALKASGRKVLTLNLNHKSDKKRLLEHTIINKKIDVVMTGGFGVNYYGIKMIVDTAKHIRPDIITVVGGNIISADPVVAMKALENADYGIIGEGEITVNALAYALETDNDAANVDGVICYRNNEWVARGNPQTISDLNVLPFPDYEGFELGLAIENGGQPTLTISRSCPNSCTFCFHNSCRLKYSELSIDTIFKNLDYLISLYPFKMIYLDGEVAFYDLQFARDFCRRIKPYNVEWYATIRVDSCIVSKEMFCEMKSSGCYLLLIGIESASKKILKSMRKGIKIEQAERAIDCAAQAGLAITGNLIFGDLEETTKTVKRTIGWYQSINRRYAHTNTVWLNMIPIRIYPGSHLYKTACEREIIKDPVQFLKDGFPLVNISKLSDDEYGGLPGKLHVLNIKNKLIVTQIEPQNDMTINIAGLCPHCANSIQYYHFQYMFDVVPQACHCCKCMIVVNPIEHCDLEKLNNNAEKLIRGTTAAVWGITAYNYFWILKSMPILKSHNVKFVNKNELKIGVDFVSQEGLSVKTLEGKEVFTPDIINTERVDTVIVPVTPRLFNEIKTQCEAEFESVKRIVHITELLYRDDV